jgi:hypothetical protein
MNAERLAERLKQIVVEQLPLPGAGNTAERHSRLMQIGREDLSLAKLAEAHWDAVAILAEAGGANLHAGPCTQSGRQRYRVKRCVWKKRTSGFSKELRKS